MQRRNVDLPDPDGPIRHVTSPRLTTRFTPLRTLTPAYHFSTLSASTMIVTTSPPSPPRRVVLASWTRFLERHGEVAEGAWVADSAAIPSRSDAQRRTGRSKGSSRLRDTTGWRLPKNRKGVVE